MSIEELYKELNIPDQEESNYQVTMLNTRTIEYRVVECPWDQPDDYSEDQWRDIFNNR